MEKNTSTDKSRLLRRALIANAAFSAATAIVMLAGGRGFSEAIGLGEPLALGVVGLGLLLFAGALVVVATRARVAAALALLFSLGDFTWVIASAVLLLVWPSLFNPAGEWLVAGVAAAVAVFGVAQVEGLRKLARNDRPGARAALEVSGAVAAPPAQAWAIVADVHGYAAYAPSLDFSRILAGTGVGAVRECGDAKGRWTETCTLWEEGRRYTFEIDTRAKDYPYPFRVLRGDWRVDPAPGGCRITMRFEATVKGGYFGDILMALALPKFEKGAIDLLANWEQAILAQGQTAAA
jgi:ribosome-associated toxin RatA of RatAB toxin-antitoxin module